MKKISQFLGLNLDNVWDYPLVFDSETTTELGNNLKYYALDLDVPVLGVFTRMMVRQFDNSKTDINISLRGHLNYMPDELIEFIHFITKEYGVDSSGFGDVELYECNDIILTDFWIGRIWENVLMISYNGSDPDTGGWELTLFSK